MTSPYADRELNTLVELQPYQMNSNIYQNLRENLTNRVAGKCIMEGYVCKIYKISDYKHPEIVAENFNSIAVYDVVYIARICNPVHGSIITLKITEINKAIIEARNGPIQAILDINKHDPNIFFVNSYGNLCYKTLDGDKDSKKGKVLNKDDYIKILVTTKKYDINDNIILVLGIINNIPSENDIEEMKNELVSTKQDVFVNPSKVNKNVDDFADDFKRDKDERRGFDSESEEDTDNGDSDDTEMAETSESEMSGGDSSGEYESSENESSSNNEESNSDSDEEQDDRVIDV